MIPAPPYAVTCSRCGVVGSSLTFFIEEGDEWECPPCYERCEAHQRRSEAVSQADNIYDLMAWKHKAEQAQARIRELEEQLELAKRLVYLRKNVGNAEYEAQCRALCP